MTRLEASSRRQRMDPGTLSAAVERVGRSLVKGGAKPAADGGGLFRFIAPFRGMAASNRGLSCTD